MLEKQLFDAIKINDTAKITEILEQGIAVNIQNDAGKTPVEYAAENGHWQALTTIVTSRKDDVDNTGAYNKALLKAAFAGRFAEFTLLYNNGAKPDWKLPSNGYMAIHFVMLHNNLDAIKLIATDSCSAGVSFAELLRFAITNSKISVVSIETLLSIEGLAIPETEENCDYLILACKQPDIDKFNLILQTYPQLLNTPQAFDHKTPLHIAAENNCLGHIQSLLELGVDTKAKDSSLQTAALIAARNNNWECVDLIAKNKLATQSSQFSQVLLVAVKCNQQELAGFLLEAGADPNYVEPISKNQAMHYACLNNNIQLIAKLLSFHARYDQVNAAGQFPLIIAAEQKNWKAVSLILNVTQQNAELKLDSINELIAVLFAEQRYDIANLLAYKYPMVQYECSETENSLLHLICEFGFIDSLQAILPHQSDDILAKKNKYNQTPLDILIESNNWDCAEILLRVLLDRSNHNDLFADGKVLYHAVKANQEMLALEIEKLTSQNFANPADGETIADVACERNMLELVSLLLKKTVKVKEKVRERYRHRHSYAPTCSYRTVTKSVFDFYDATSKPESSLVIAAKNFNWGIVHLILSERKCTSVKDIGIALKYAVISENIAEIKFLLENKAVVNYALYDIDAPMELACDSGNVEIVSLLHNAGFSVNLRKLVDSGFWDCVSACTYRPNGLEINLGYAAYQATIQNKIKLRDKLINIGAYEDLTIHEASSSDDYSEGLLHLAIRLNDMELIENLLKYGIEQVTVKDTNGDSPLMLAGRQGLWGIILCILSEYTSKFKILSSELKRDIKDCIGDVVELAICDRQDRNIIEPLLDHGIFNSTNAIQTAIEQDNWEVVKLIIKRINSRDISSDVKRRFLLQALTANQDELYSFLVSGVNMLTLDEQGNNLYHLAVLKSDINLVKSLVKMMSRDYKQASETENKDNLLPLEIAAANQDWHFLEEFLNLRVESTLPISPREFNVCMLAIRNGIDLPNLNLSLVQLDSTMFIELASTLKFNSSVTTLRLKCDIDINSLKDFIIKNSSILTLDLNDSNITGAENLDLLAEALRQNKSLKKLVLSCVKLNNRIMRNNMLSKVLSVLQMNESNIVSLDVYCDRNERNKNLDQTFDRNYKLIKPFGSYLMKHMYECEINKYGSRLYYNKITLLLMLIHANIETNNFHLIPREVVFHIFAEIRHFIPTLNAPNALAFTHPQNLIFNNAHVPNNYRNSAELWIDKVSLTHRLSAAVTEFCRLYDTNKSIPLDLFKNILQMLDSPYFEKLTSSTLKLETIDALLRMRYIFEADNQHPVLIDYNIDYQLNRVGELILATRYLDLTEKQKVDQISKIIESRHQFIEHYAFSKDSDPKKGCTVC